MSDKGWVCFITVNFLIILTCITFTSYRQQKELNKVYKEVVRMREIIEEDANDEFVYEKSEFMDRIVDFKLSLTEIK